MFSGRGTWTVIEFTRRAMVRKRRRGRRGQPSAPKDFSWYPWEHIVEPNRVTRIRPKNAKYLCSQPSQPGISTDDEPQNHWDNSTNNTCVIVGFRFNTIMFMLWRLDQGVLRAHHRDLGCGKPWRRDPLQVEAGAKSSKVLFRKHNTRPTYTFCC